LLAYIGDKNFDHPQAVHLEDQSLRWFLVLCILPFLSVFGAFAMNDYASNVLTLILYVAIGFAMLYIAFSAKFPKELYPLAIFAIALSMLFSTSLISPYIVGWDIQLEYYFAALVVHNGAWNWTLPGDFNGLLSVVMIPPMISILGKIDLDFVFKVIYSLLFALVPAGLYIVFKRIATEKIAFLSAFFVICTFTFFLDLPQLARQEIAELFLVLVLLLLVSNEIKGVAKANLLLVFSCAMIVSHYSLSVIYIGIFLATALAMNLIYSLEALGVRNKVSKSARLGREEDTVSKNGNRSETLSLAFVFLLMVVAFVWYSYAASGSIFSSLAATQQYFFGRFTADLGVSGSTGLAAAVATIPGPLHEAATWVRFLFEFFIVVGLMVTVSRRGRLKAKETYLCIGFGSFALLVASAVLPNLGSTLNIDRFYQIATLTLAPFSIVGGIFLIDAAQKYLLAPRKPSFKVSIRVVAVLLLISFLFESSLLYQVIEHDSGIPALNPTINWPIFNTQELVGANWWHAVKNNSSFIYADGLNDKLLIRTDGTDLEWGQFIGGNHVRALVTQGGGTDPDYSYTINMNASGRNAYVFLGTKNIETGGLATEGAYGLYNYVNQSQVLSGRSEVYDNGGAQVYFG
jgi:uncharacterized membrane protein